MEAAQQSFNTFGAPQYQAYAAAGRFASPFAAPASGSPIAIKTVYSGWEKVWFFTKVMAVCSVVGCLLYAVEFRSLKGGEEGGDGVQFKISNAHSLMKSVTTRFNDVKGIDEVKDELVEVVEYLKDPAKFAKMGAKLPKGVMMVGSPGTGKTLLARAIAGEAGVPFFYASGSSFDELYVGVGPKRMRNMFEDARASAPCIIFIDEIDSVGTSRRATFSSSYAKESTLNQFLTELDGFQQNEGIIVIGATNFVDALDPALMRPGRFDKTIHVTAPDLKGREEILGYYLNKVQLEKDVDPRRLAKATPGFTGADLSNLVNRAAIKAVIQKKNSVDMDVLEEARDDIFMGNVRRFSEMGEDARRRTSYHEGGHTLLALYAPGAKPLHKVTIVPRGSALGVTWRLSDKDEVDRSRQQLKAELAVMMAGRAAEEVIFGEDGVTTGAESDFQNATHFAQKMVAQWGMSDKVGMVYHSLKQDGSSLVSPEQRNLIDSEVKELLKASYEYAKATLKEHEKELHDVAEALLERETLSADEVKEIIHMDTGAKDKHEDLKPRAIISAV